MSGGLLSFDSSSKYEKMPGAATSQSPGTSNWVPHLGLVTTFQPAMSGLASPSAPRGFASGEDADSEGLAGADDFLSSATFLPSLSSSLFSTTTPVTAAATTTAVAATMATTVVFFLSLPGWGPPGGPGTAYCGTVGCW